MARPLTIVKPTQSGKTSSVLSKTTRLIERDVNSVHVILVDNSLIQLDQLNNRIIAQTGQVPLVLNGDNNIPLREIHNGLCDYAIKYILICTNNIQIKKIDRLLVKMLTTPVRRCKGRIFYIWVDEGDKIATPDNTEVLDKWLKYRNVETVTYVTATPHSLIIRYDKMKVVKVEKIYDKRLYNKWSDCRINLIAEQENPEDYINVAFRRCKPKKGQRWFITPGSLSDTHDDITAFLNSKGFYVLTINFKGEIVTTPGGKEVNIGGKASLSDRIGDMYQAMKLREHKFAIVGYNRLGRGITIQSPKMLISHAVFPTVPQNKASIYQLAGRLCGNTKKFPGYRQPIVFCTEHFDEVAFESEDIAITIPKHRWITTKSYDKIEEKAIEKFRRSYTMKHMQ